MPIESSRLLDEKSTSPPHNRSWVRVKDVRLDDERTETSPADKCARARACEHICVCMCACVRVCVWCMCVCVCVWALMQNAHARSSILRTANRPSQGTGRRYPPTHANPRANPRANRGDPARLDLATAAAHPQPAPTPAPAPAPAPTFDGVQGSKARDGCHSSVVVEHQSSPNHLQLRENTGAEGRYPRVLEQYCSRDSHRIIKVAELR